MLTVDLSITKDQFQNWSRQLRDKMNSKAIVSLISRISEIFDYIIHGKIATDRKDSFLLSCITVCS